MTQHVDNLAAPVYNVNPEQIWADSLEIIRENVNAQSYHTWFSPIMPLKMDGGCFTIQVPSQFFYEWIEEHYPHVIREALTQVLGKEMDINYTIRQRPANPSCQSNSYFSAK